MLKKTKNFCKSFINEHFFISSVAECLKCRAGDQHDLALKPTRAIQLCFWERHFTALFPVWWSWEAIKLQLTLF